MCVISHVHSTFEQFQTDHNMHYHCYHRLLPLGTDSLPSHFLLGISLTVTLLTASLCCSICKFDAAKKWGLDTTLYLYQILL
jgi:hypothetical protein